MTAPPRQPMRHLRRRRSESALVTVEPSVFGPFDRFVFVGRGERELVRGDAHEADAVLPAPSAPPRGGACAVRCGSGHDCTSNSLHERSRNNGDDLRDVLVAVVDQADSDRRTRAGAD